MDQIDLNSAEHIIAFHFLYVKLKLGQNIFPWETFMFYSGIFLETLPPEINHKIGRYIFHETGSVQPKKTTALLLEAFKANHAQVFEDYLRKLFGLLKYPSKVAFSWSDLIKGIYAIENLRHAHTNPIIYFEPLALFDFPQVMLYLIPFIRNALRYTNNPLLKDDRKVITAAVKHNGLALKHASPNLQNQKDIVVEAVSRNAHAFQFASDTLKDDKEFVKTVLDQDGMMLAYVSKRLQDDPEILKLARSQILSELNFITRASEFGRNDRADFTSRQKQALLDHVHMQARLIDAINNMQRYLNL